MAPRRPSPLFGFPAPDFGAALDKTVGDVRRGFQTAVASGRQTVDAARREAEHLNRLARTEMEKVGLLAPAQRTTPASVNPPRKIVTSAKTLRPNPASSGSPPAYAQSGGTSTADRLREAALQADTVARGAADIISFGYADELAAGANVLVNRDERTFGERYAEYHKAEQARDAYDAEHRAAARTIGQVGGLGLSLFSGAAPVAVTRTLLAAAARKATPKILQSAPRVLGQMKGSKSLGSISRLQTSASEYAVASAGAGAVNGGLTAAEELARTGNASAGDVIGGAAGGAASAPVAIFSRSPALAGATEGFTTSVVQDLANARRPSMDKALHSAANGGMTAGLAGEAGTVASNALSPRAKGQLGEGLSVVKTLARGEIPLLKHTRKDVGGAYTVLDPASTSTQIVESKFGRYAKLSKAQKKAYSQDPNNYRIDWWQPVDIGRITGFGAGTLGSHLGDRDESAW